MCIGEEGELQEQNVRLLVHLVNTMSVTGVSFLNLQLFLLFDTQVY
jgi:hypothetical protein